MWTHIGTHRGHPRPLVFRLLGERNARREHGGQHFAIDFHQTFNRISGAGSRATGHLVELPVLDFVQEVRAAPVGVRERRQVLVLVLVERCPR
jgi:hypothetical protein